MKWWTRSVGLSGFVLVGVTNVLREGEPGNSTDWSGPAIVIGLVLIGVGYWGERRERLRRADVHPR